MNYPELSFTARLLDPMLNQPAVHVLRNSLNQIPGNNTAGLLSLFFGVNDERYLSRSEIMSLSRRKNVDLFSLSVLFWGFPTNQHRVCTSALQNWNTLLGWARRVRENRLMTRQRFVEMIPTMHNDLRGLGISTYSKYLYFSGCSIDGNQCLILDNLVVKGIHNLTGIEFDELKDTVQNNRHRYYRNYPLYLEAMQNLSLNIGVPAHNIEYVLWLAGKRNM